MKDLDFIFEMPSVETLATFISIKGEKGQDGTVSFNDLTDEQKAMLKGEKGIDYVNNIESMKSYNLKVGDTISTLGYYSVNDGGNATYIIRTKKDSDVIDNCFIHEINSILVAELLIENNTVNIRQLGARSQDKQNNKYDIAPVIQKYLDYLNTVPNRVKLYIPSGVWYSSPCLIAREEGFDIYGDEGFTIHRADGTVISSLNDNQDYIFQIGTNAYIMKNWNLKNIIFTSADCEYKESLNCFVFKTPKKINLYCAKFLYATFGITDNICFVYIKGQAFNIVSCWEIYFKLLNFRHISNHDGSIMCFDTADKTLNEYANITACNFEKIMFEATHGNLMNFEHSCDFGNNHFGVINFEDYKYIVDGEVYTTFTDEIIETFDEENAIHNSLINVAYGGVLNATVINSIEMNNVSFRYHEYDEKIYTYDTLIKVDEYSKLGLIIDKINIVGMNKDMRILKKGNYEIKNDSELIINSILNNQTGNKSFCFDVKGFTRIKCESSLKGFLKDETFLGNFIPFYETMMKRSTNFLYSDENAMNKLQLCAKPTTQNGMRFLIENKNILIRAKIPLNETVDLAIVKSDASSWIHLIMEGTGEFTNYNFDISSKLNIGDEVDCRMSSSTSEIECLLDYYKFY